MHIRDLQTETLWPEYAQTVLNHGIRTVLAVAQHSETAANLKAALDSRTVIDSAVGIIIGQNRCSQDEAIELFQSASNARNVKPRDVAQAVVESAGGGQLKTPFS
ncbi:MAG TPA: ANTAR domain-containing protein [Arthrobacter sp.]|nr:ANTAR domain-containing protein [Arthrobacter sp.]